MSEHVKSSLSATPTRTQEIVAGLFAGVCESIATHPIDQIKTQFQLNRHANGGIWTSFSGQYASGGVSRLYRGVFAACLRPGTVCVYTGNEWSKRFVGGIDAFQMPGTGELSVMGGFAAGFLTGYPEAFGVTPFEVVKVRMQSLEHVGLYTSSIECAKSVIRNEGLRGIYQGVGATCARNCTFNGVFFGSTRAIRTFFELEETPTSDFAVACVSAMGATVVKMPFDVTKSRIQNQLPIVTGNRDPGISATRYTSVIQCLTTVSREEGIAALYKGLVPTAIRMTLGMCVAQVAFSEALRQASNAQQPKGF